MFARVLCAFCLLASPAAAEILVQDGDYYPKLIGLEPIRITGGRIDELIVGGFQTTIEGGSFGKILDMGGTPFLFRSGALSMDRGIEFFRIPEVTFEGFEFFENRVQANIVGVGGQFIDYSTGGVSIATNSDLCHGMPRICPAEITYILHDFTLPNPGDTNRDLVVDLIDINNVRNHFGGAGMGDTTGDGFVNLADLNSVRNNFGADYRASSNPVPEPPTSMLLLAGMTALLLARSWRCRPNPA